MPIDAAVGTNRELATGRARGTGHYRPSPLLRVRDAYLHHGAVPTLEDLFSPTREAGPSRRAIASARRYRGRIARR